MTNPKHGLVAPAEFAYHGGRSTCTAGPMVESWRRRVIRIGGTRGRVAMPRRVYMRRPACRDIPCAAFDGERFVPAGISQDDLEDNRRTSRKRLRLSQSLRQLAAALRLSRPGRRNERS
jgi:hypothetical protein